MDGQYFQGDLMFRKVKSGDPCPKPDKKILVLAKGEKTGHQHVVDTEVSDVRGYALFSDRQVIVVGEKGADVTHDEHETLHLNEGTYQVTQQRRWTPAKPEKVID